MDINFDDIDIEEFDNLPKRGDVITIKNCEYWDYEQKKWINASDHTITVYDIKLDSDVEYYKSRRNGEKIYDKEKVMFDGYDGYVVNDSSGYWPWFKYNI